MSVANPNFVALGDINPCRIVAMVINGGSPAAANRSVAQATAGGSSHGDFPLGISGDGTRRFDATLHAIAGEQVQVNGPGTYALLELGSGGCTAGAQLKSDANGKGLATTTNLDMVVGTALEAGSAGEKVLVLVHPMQLST